MYIHVCSPTGRTEEEAWWGFRAVSVKIKFYYHRWDSNPGPQSPWRNKIIVATNYIVNTALWSPLLRHYAGVLVVLLPLKLMRRSCCYY
jgi:hypothetical protein